MAYNKNKIVIPHQDVVDIINTEDIIYCQANDGYTMLCLVDKKELLDITKSLTKFSKELNQNYMILTRPLSQIIPDRETTKLL